MAKNINTRAVVEQNVRLWLAKLESGELTQGTGALEQNDKFCCLGVACNVVGAEREPSTFLENAMTYDGAQDYLPNTVRKKLGLKDIDPVVKVALKPNGVFDLEKLPDDDDDGYRLSILNDQYYLTFKEIAKVIRLNKNTLFRYKNLDI